MIFAAVSIFTDMFDALTRYGITGRAFDEQICTLLKFNPRDFTKNKHRRVDDRPFGGGNGMVLQVEPLELATLAAIDKINDLCSNADITTVYLSPQGWPLRQDVVHQLLEHDATVLICGRYEGVDERFIKRNVDVELSIGDFVCSGGEIPAMALMDAMIRRLPRVLGNDQSSIHDSFMNGLLDHAVYTHPRCFNNDCVPNVLLSGNHQEIANYKLKMQMYNTHKRRPDLLDRQLTTQEYAVLQQILEAECYS